MKYFYALIFSVLFISTNSFAQCPGCTIDSTLTTPGIYPNPLPDGTQGQTYDQNVTFVMFTDTQSLTVNYFKITSVTGLPLGLDWECNNAFNGCQYDPQVSIYGCVKVCGTPIQSGQFTLNVNIDVNLDLVGTQQSTVEIPIFIQAAAGGNSSFTYSPSMGCDSMTVDFQSLISSPGIPSYQWDFGDGNFSTDVNAQHNYLSPGIYSASLQTILSQYSLTDVNVASVNDNWCGDVEEPDIFGCTGDPDLYFTLTDASGNVIYTSGTIDDVNSATWSNLGLGLSNPPYSVGVWDEDPISVNDNLGTFSFSPSATGVINLNGAGGTTLNLTIGLQTIAEFNDMDTVWVMPSPAEPIVTAFENDTICSDEVSVLTTVSNSSLMYQWYESASPLIGATNDSLIVNATGDYNVIVSYATGCSTASLPTTITQMSSLPNITFLINGNTLTTFMTGYDLQWYLDGVPVSGATQDGYTISTSGDYSLLACNSFGCCRSSDTFYVSYTGIHDEQSLSQLSVLYNGLVKEIVLDGTLLQSESDVVFYDALGRLLLTESVSPQQVLKIDVTDWSNGLYFVRDRNSFGSNVTRIVIAK